MASNEKSLTPYVDFEHQRSPYYTERHQRWRLLCRKWIHNEVLPNVKEWDTKGTVPLSAYKVAYDYGVLSQRYPSAYDGTPFEGKLEDPFSVIIYWEEAAPTFMGPICTTFLVHTISVPPVMHFGSEYLKQMYRPVIRGEVVASLAISESKFGSDVANIETTAVKSKCGQFYVVNGEKKWISNGTKSSFFTTAVRTGGPQSAHRGLSMLVIPRCEGVKTFRIPTQGMRASETAQIFFKDVKVPVQNLIGKENHGFYYIMFNFNQERFNICAACIAWSRQLIIEAAKYARQHEVFEKRLIDYQIVRHKIADMARATIAAYAFVERCAYQLSTDPLGQKDASVGANIALCKATCTKSYEFCARETSQIFGRDSTKLGSMIDRAYRDVRAVSIFGGSEEIMMDVSTRLARL